MMSLVGIIALIVLLIKEYKLVNKVSTTFTETLTLALVFESDAFLLGEPVSARNMTRW